MEGKAPSGKSLSQKREAFLPQLLSVSAQCLPPVLLPKGYGVLAEKPLKAGELIYQEAPALVVDSEAGGTKLRVVQ